MTPLEIWSMSMQQESKQIVIDRILELSKKHNLSHIGSCISMVPIFMDIYTEKDEGDFVVMSNAHAHLAHLVFRETVGEIEDAEHPLKLNGIHCDRSVGCDASGGSLGHAGGIAIGLALANPDQVVYWTVSDGSLGEGSDWEAMRIISKLEIDNIELYCNLNGSTALEEVPIDELAVKIKAFYPDAHIYYTQNGEGFEGVQGHYKVQ